MTIVDTHLHVIDQRRLEYPWLAGYPQLQGNYLYETYAAEARQLGIATTLLMEVDVPVNQIEREAGMAYELRQQFGGPIAGAISSCRPEYANFAAFLERQMASQYVRGFRRVLHVVPDEISLAPLFRANLKLLGPARRPFDLCVFARQLPIAAELADACPDVQFVLDHCGQPDIQGGEWQPWADGIRRLAERPNVAVKISGIAAYTDLDAWTAETLRPYVEHCIAAFGWDRVVWGSDWPICLAAGSLSHWVEATHALLRGCSESERHALLAGNAQRIYDTTVSPNG